MAIDINAPLLIGQTRTEIQGQLPWRDAYVEQATRQYHSVLIGATRSGKTVLAQNMAIQDMLAGRGVGFIDPHGEAVLQLLDFVPGSALNRVVYFDATDETHCVGLNPVAYVPVEDRPLMRDNIVEGIRSAYNINPLEAVRLMRVLRHSVSAVLDIPNASLLTISRLLSDETYLRKHLPSFTEPTTKAWWTNTYLALSPREKRDYTESTMNRLEPLFGSPKIRQILGQAPKVSLRHVMDERCIFLANLSKGDIGEENTRLIGSLLLAMFKTAAYARSRRRDPDEPLAPFNLFIDEFADTAGDAPVAILREQSKNGLYLSLLTQSVLSIDKSNQQALLDNVGNFYALRTGLGDAALLHDHGIFDTDTVSELSSPQPFHARVRLVARHGFVTDEIKTGALAEHLRQGNAGKVVQHSREHFSRKREVVEREIRRQLAWG